MKNINTISMYGEKFYQLQTLINPNWAPTGQARVSLGQPHFVCMQQVGLLELAQVPAIWLSQTWTLINHNQL